MYEGEVDADGKATGEGIWVSQFGDTYKGTFKSNERHGLSK